MILLAKLFNLLQALQMEDIKGTTDTPRVRWGFSLARQKLGHNGNTAIY